MSDSWGMGEREYYVVATTADEPLEQYVIFWQRLHLFKPVPVGNSTSDLLQATQTRVSVAGFAESAIVMFSFPGEKVGTIRRITRYC